MSYLRNTWYMAAWAEELGDKPLARTFLDEPVVLVRGEAGEARALLDRCPHRFAPLSKGRIEEGALVCPYHGLAFAGGGACVRNPHGPVARSLAVKAYPVHEAHRAIWIWMGEPSLADPADIRDLSFLALAPDTAFNSGYLNGVGHYQLFVDNILDLSHTEFLHSTTLGGGAITRTRPLIEERADGVIAIHWRPKNDVPTPLMGARLPGIVRVDAWTEVEWSAPGVMTLTAGAVPAGAPREQGDNVFNVHILTPESATRSHYFFASTRDFRIDDAEFNAAMGETRATIFATEDEPMIAAQQARMGDAQFWDLKPALLKIDQGPVLVRRRMDALIAKEQAA